MSSDQVFPFPGFLIYILVLNGQKCKLWASRTKGAHFQTLRVTGARGGKSGVAPGDPPLAVCLGKPGYCGNTGLGFGFSGSWGSICRTLRKGVIGSSWF